MDCVQFCLVDGIIVPLVDPLLVYIEKLIECVGGERLCVGCSFYNELRCSAIQILQNSSV